MTQLKSFDCVEYKQAIQDRHIAETQGMSFREKSTRRLEWLKHSNNPSAKLWREMKSRREAKTAR